MAGYYRHAAGVLRGVDPPSIRLSAAAVAKLRVTLTPSSPALVYHRDGWLFQLISWIGLQRSLGPHSAALAPHSQPADKGIDTFAVQWDPSNAALSHVTIGEDKATDNPRATIREKVWPELVEWESGARDHELISATTMVLEGAQVPQPERLTENVFWNRVRRYRVNITVTAPHDAKRHTSLYAGYSSAAPGPQERRTGDVFLTNDIRAWLEGFSKKVLAALESMQGT
jgi:hypothetical protein